MAENEKTQQIKLMGGIYSGAAKVIAWLEVPDIDSFTELECFHAFVARMKNSDEMKSIYEGYPYNLTTLERISGEMREPGSDDNKTKEQVRFILENAESLPIPRIYPHSRKRTVHAYVDHSRDMPPLKSRVRPWSQ
jgi:hypothetical protein